MAITFRTNSKNIALKWNTEEEEPSLNTTFILQKGFDLYIKKDNKWVFAGVATPTVGTRHQSPIVENMDESVKTCLLYLPIFANINRLELGIDEGSVIEKVENKFRHKIVVIGSSITHGAAASRPGMAYPAQLNRHLGFEFPNLEHADNANLINITLRLLLILKLMLFYLMFFLTLLRNK